MHSKSDCRLLWRVAADMFIVVMALGAEGEGGGGVGAGGGRSPTSEFLKLPVYMEVKQMGTLGCGGPLSTHLTTPSNPQTHTHINLHSHTSMPAHPTSIRQLFFLQLLQSHATASFTATICPQSAHAPCGTFKDVILNISILIFLI